MKKERKNDLKVDYWQSMADVLSVLLLIFILLLMLMAVDWVAEQEKDKQDEVVNIEPALPLPSLGDAANILGNAQTAQNKSSTASGNGSKGEYEEKPDETVQTEDEGLAAVRVIVIDGETKKPIKQKGITLQLYTSGGTLKTLNTYYPQRLTYSAFETTETGSFYLPEKIALGGYYFENTTAPTGYSIGDDVPFQVDEAYYWENPFVLRFPVYPATRSISIVMKDSDTGKGVTGGTFDVIAKEDIITQDGTVRANEGDCVDTVSCDEDGMAETKELYLGNYEIQEKTPPETYASIEESVDVKMDTTTSDKEPEQTELTCQQTKVIVAVQDELEESMSAEGAVYVLSKENGDKIEEYRVESDGSFEITGLDKDTNYHLTQVEWGENYEQTESDMDFYVDDMGFIEGAAVKNMTLYNRKIRVRIEAREMLLRNSISGCSLALKDEEGNEIKEFKTSSNPIEIEGIEPGTYYLYSTDGRGKQKQIQIQDDKEIQSFEYSIWTTNSTIVCVVLLIIMIVILAIFIRNRQKKGKQ